MASIARTAWPLSSRVLSKTACRSMPNSVSRWQTSTAAAKLVPLSRPLSMSRAAFEKRYTKDHEWIELSADGETGTIGISKYAASALGDVVYVELPTIDLEVSAGDSIGAVESVKSASDILTPVSGVVAETNGVLEEKPSVINQGPEDEGWIAKIKIKDRKECDELMTTEAYGKFTEGGEKD